MKYKINKDKCTGCRMCVSKCPGATKIKDGKAVIVDEDKLEECGGEKLCPFGAIEKLEGNENKEKEDNGLNNQSQGFRKTSPMRRQGGRGMGRGRKRR